MSVVALAQYQIPPSEIVVHLPNRAMGVDPALLRFRNSAVVFTLSNLKYSSVAVESVRRLP